MSLLHPLGPPSSLLYPLTLRAAEKVWVNLSKLQGPGAQQSLQWLPPLAAAAHAPSAAFRMWLQSSHLLSSLPFQLLQPQSLGTLSRCDLNALSFSFSPCLVSICKQRSCCLQVRGALPPSPSYFLPMPLFRLRLMSCGLLNRNYKFELT